MVNGRSMELPAFLIQGVAQPVKRLDRPLFPDVSGQVGGVYLLGFRAGDAERGDG